MNRAVTGGAWVDQPAKIRNLQFRCLDQQSRKRRKVSGRLQAGPLLAEKEIYDLAKTASLGDLCQESASLRDEKHKIITFSPKPPAPGRRAYMTLEEVVQIAAQGAKQGCAEALFTLGDKPELLYPEARRELKEMGFGSTVEYVAEASRIVMQETGLLPHINAGVLTRDEFAALKTVSGSQGLMLETASKRLMQPGMPHYDCPDKEPEKRLDAIRAAGEAEVPFTSGLLIGIGETREERIHALLQLQDIHAEYGHLEELIIQNFQPKKNTAMAFSAEPPLEELLWTIAMARLIFGPEMNIQAPPNLTPGIDESIALPLMVPASLLTSGVYANDTEFILEGLEGSQSASWKQLLDAGINDWGGLSPLTRDFVNPEKPWPHLKALADATAASGKCLVPRLTLYPEFALQPGKWLDSSRGRNSVSAAVFRHSDVHGLLRGSEWVAGQTTASQQPSSPSSNDSLQPALSLENKTEIEGLEKAAPKVIAAESQKLHSSTPMPRPKLGTRSWGVRLGQNGLLDVADKPPARPKTLELLSAVLDSGHELSETEMVELFEARGADFDAVCSAAATELPPADVMRDRLKGNEVTYGVVRNINYTNVCTYRCGFCAFSKGKMAEDLRGAPYLIDLDEVSRRTAEAWNRGASEVCMQGGIHPDFTGNTYLRILEAAKKAAPDIHVHAFSPLEVTQGAATLGWPLDKFLTALKDAGLGSLPGTAAEVLDDDVRAVLCPDKLNSSQWLEVIETAHKVGLKTTSTIMFGHCDTTQSWATHLRSLRDVQRRTMGITEFVPLPFVHMEAPIFLKGKARKGPTLRECYLMHSIARLALAGYINNIQASWVKMGPERAVSLMKAGCNDMGGTLMNESITRAAGASYGQELPPERMEELIRSAGRTSRQRTTSYESVFPSQTQKSFGAQPLEALEMERFYLHRQAV